jgi:hypothetical protein
MATTITTSTDQDHDEQAASAAVSLHRAELALHDARQTGVDAWISAAADRLHEAVLAYTQTHVPAAIAA